MKEVLSLVFGGAIGTLARYFLSGLVNQSFGSSFPYGTLIVNILGCFLIGLFISSDKILISQEIKILLVTGFCGAFTTFSTLIYESDLLLKFSSVYKVFFNIFLSVTLGFLFFRLGVSIGKEF